MSGDPQASLACARWSELLSAALDETLPPGDAELAREHAASCHDCGTRLASYRALKHAIARLTSREAPPGAVRAHVESLALQTRRSSRLGTAAWWLLAAGLASAAPLYVALQRGPDGPGAELAQDLVADHLHSVPEAMPAEVTTEDPAEAVRFFSGRVPFEPVVPRLEGARLIGGRLCKIHGRRVQLLFYRFQGVERDETVSLFVSDQHLGGSGCRESRGLQVCSVSSDELLLLAVGAVPAAELRRLLDSAEADTR
jgi:anti-sigma factor RsiW